MRRFVTGVGVSRIASAAAALAVAALVVFASPALAGTAVLTVDAEFGDASVTYTASPGEHNDVTVTAALDSVTFDDAGPGVAVTAGRGCDQIGSHTARCYPRRDRVFTNVNAGDEDDSVRFAAGPDASGTFSAYGGAGDDRLTAGDRAASLDGGDGVDTLMGGPGGDTLVGGAGGDAITAGGGDDSITPDGDGAAAASDLVDGGPGSDSVSYSERSTGVDVDLERPEGNGGRGENDTIRGVEAVSSGNGPDVLRGDEGANVLTSTGRGSGAGGPDVIEGRGGDDQIEGSYGADVLSGGPGNDEIESNGGADRLSGGPGDDGIDLLDARPRALSCGSGDDLLNYPRASEVIRPSCETVQVDNFFFLVRTSLGRVPGRAGARTVSISWFLGLDELPCLVVARLSRAGHGHGRGPGRGQLGRGSVRLPRKDPGAGTIRLRLTSAGRHALRSRKPVPLRLSFVGHDTCRGGANDVSGAGALTFLSR
jgi:Ca2+-binding RTX toxin-like protein